MRFILSIIGAVVLIYYALQPPIHILDFVMCFVTIGVIWGLLELIGGGEYTRELGGALIGVPVIFIATIIYAIVFVGCGVDWIDIFHGVYNVNISEWFRW